VLGKVILKDGTIGIGSAILSGGVAQTAVSTRAAAGYSDLEHHVPMRVDDAFHMASVNKTLTAVAVLRLIDDRKLSFTATLKECLGEAVAKIPNAARITVSQLLDHSSGIYPTNNDMEYLTTVIGPKADPTRSWSPKELIALASKPQNKPTAEPGQGTTTPIRTTFCWE
jgi:D-alanyl-D-alanine carboxypeptidase